MKVNVYHNGDDVFIAWKPDGFIPACRGFALLRRRNGVDEVVSTWVGFEKDKYKEGEREPSTRWPIQKYQWTDYMAAPGDRLRYRVVPMIGPNKDSLASDLAHASGWTKTITLTPQLTPKISAFFNRGIVASQWITRRLGLESPSDAKAAKLRTVIAKPGDPFRTFLCGPLGERLFALLDKAARQKREIYAALYELDDEQLETALERLGLRAHIILANGSVAKKGEDQNAEARARLADKIDLRHRMLSPAALAHNKFLVICDAKKKPRWVWTGSQNWTRTGLCTQANNSVLIDDPALAEFYRAQWDRLAAAGDVTTPEFKASQSTVHELPIRNSGVRLWFTPTVGLVDLEDAKKAIVGAEKAILFLMFNPGPKETLLNKIIDTARETRGGRLYIRGVLNQDPSTTASPVELFSQANRDKADFDVVLPAAIDETTAFWQKELKQLPGTFAMVHSKVVLIDPFGPHPIVITGSHNLGPKASGTNDENLLIIRDAPGLAAGYASNIMAIYNQYRWRFRRHVQSPAQRWKGLQDSDTWQNGYLKPGSAALREIDFWSGA